MRILFVSLALPFPPNNGQRLRNWGMLRALAEEGHRVALVSFAEPHEYGGDLGPLHEVCESVTLVEMPGRVARQWTTHLGRLLVLFSPLPYGTLRYQSAEMSATVRSLLDQNDSDIVICDDIYQFKNLPESSRHRTLLNKHDFTFVIMKRYLARTWNPLKLAYGWLEGWKVRRWEMLVCSRVAGVLVCSEHDGALLRAAIPNVRMNVVPNVIDIEGYRPRENDDGKTLLFFGAMDYYANEDAADFFISRILPEVRKANPETRLVVAGRNPSLPLLRRYAGVPGVEFTGTVADMQTVIARATVCVVPLRIGSGTRLKILEAAAMEKGIVSTRLGAEGLELTAGHEILLADEPKEFARAIAELLSQPARRRALGEAARKKVEKMYSLAALRSALREALGDVSSGDSLRSAERVVSIRDGRAPA